MFPSPVRVSKDQNLPLKFLAFLLGFTSVIGQIVLMRELISVFYGNETAYAIILASWLFWVAAGSLTFSLFSRKIHHPRLVIFFLNTVVCGVLPLTVMAVRYLRPFLDISISSSNRPPCLSPLRNQKAVKALFRFIVGAGLLGDSINVKYEIDNFNFHVRLKA